VLFRSPPACLRAAAPTQHDTQVDTYMAKLTSDKAYRQEYLKLWKDQRK
jgi:hypothetical protein